MTSYSNRSNSASPIHTFSNPNSPLYQHTNMSQSATMTPLNLSGTRQKQKYFEKNEYDAS